MRKARQGRRWGMLLGFLLTVLVVGAGPAQAVAPPPLPPGAARWSLRGVHTDRKLVALTFDISWGTVMPPKVFAILKREHVPATIFVSGPWAGRQGAALVREMAAAGLEIESHGWAHVNYTGLSDAGVQDNILRADAVIHRLTGRHPRFVRPPNGDFNRRTLAAARAIGYTTVTWGTDSLDWMNPGVDTIIRRVTTRVHPGDIVLLHASDTCKETDLALPAVISRLKAAGYTPVTLEALLKAGTPDYRD